MSKTSSPVNAAQLAALLRLREAGVLGAMHPGTRRRLVSLGLVVVRATERSESYRPSRSFSSVRWTRTVVDIDIRLTDAGRALLAEVAS